MKKILVIILLHYFAPVANCQPPTVSDSLLMETCRSMENSKYHDDSLKVSAAFRKHLTSLFYGLNESDGKQLDESIQIRLQKVCPTYRLLVEKYTKREDDWVPLQKKPASKMDKISSRNFLDHKQYYYRDDLHDTVHLTFTADTWTDHFKDGTYSKLSLNWVSNTAFEVTFIESNNPIKNSLSVKGEKYQYELIEKFPTYYLVCLNMPKLQMVGTFKIYYQ